MYGNDRVTLMWILCKLCDICPVFIKGFLKGYYTSLRGSRKTNLQPAVLKVRPGLSHVTDKTEELFSSEVI